MDLKWFQNYSKQLTWDSRRTGGNKTSIIRSKWHILHSIRVVNKTGVEICVSMCGFVSDSGRILNSKEMKNKDMCSYCLNLYYTLRDSTELE